MTLENGKTYRIKKELRNHNPGELWVLSASGYVIYDCLQHYLFNSPQPDNKSQFHLQLWDFSEEDKYIQDNPDEYFEEVQNAANRG